MTNFSNVIWVIQEHSKDLGWVNTMIVEPVLSPHTFIEHRDYFQIQYDDHKAAFSDRAFRIKAFVPHEPPQFRA